MWGNRLGWGISAAIVLLTVWAASAIFAASQITPPTALSKDPGNLEAFTIPFPTNVVDQSDSGEAGDLYRQAIKSFDGRQVACDEFMVNPSGDPPEPIALILQASSRSQMHMFSKNPSELINYDTDHDAISTLKEICEKVAGAGITLRKKADVDGSKKYFKALVAAGESLAKERLTYEEYLAGETLMTTGLAGLAELEAENSDQRKQLESQSAAIADYDQKHIKPIWDPIASINQTVIGDNAGDVFVFASDRNKERMIRVESILKLGRYRFDALRNADQVAGLRYAKKFAEDPDPAIQAAGIAARDLTMEKYRTIH